jgi:hypothetical protein
MSETMKFIEVTKCYTLNDLDVVLSKLDRAGIDCYPENGCVYVNPEQYDKAKQLMLEGPRRSAVIR